MCGIVGFISDETHLGSDDRAKFLKQALIIDTIRGEDSTGLFTVPHLNASVDKKEEKYKFKTADWCKQVGDGYTFVNTENYFDRMAAPALLKFAIGHNRAATQGAVIADNAHPFQEGPITMVHNGTLRDDDHLPHSMTDLGVKVDSHAVCHNLALHENTEEGVQAVVSGLDGAYVLVWHDARDDTLNIVRNSERPLHFVQHRYNKTIFFASEAEMLGLLVKRLKLTCYDEALYPTPGQYMKFHGGSILEPVSTELKLHVPVYSHNRGYTAPTGKRQGTTTIGYGQTIPLKVMINGRRTSVPPVHIERLREGGFSVDDQLQFLPGTSRPSTAKSFGTSYNPKNVWGVIGGMSLPAMIYGVDVYAGLDMKQPWCVRPITVTTDAFGQDIIVCVLVRFHWKESDFKLASAAREPSSNAYSVGDEWVTEDEWTDAVSVGCSVCYLTPPKVDAPFVEWLDLDEGEYVCYDCQHKAAQGMTYLCE